jgi:ankyrin repeat protein
MATINGAEEAGDLSAAAMWGDKELLESLLKGGADPDFPNAQGDSALHEAAYYGEVECASILLDHKANVNIVGAGGKVRRNLYSITSVPCPSFFKCSPIVKNSMNHLFLSRYVIAVKLHFLYIPPPKKEQNTLHLQG